MVTNITSDIGYNKCIMIVGQFNNTDIGTQAMGEEVINTSHDDSEYMNI